MLSVATIALTLGLAVLFAGEVALAAFLLAQMGDPIRSSSIRIAAAAFTSTLTLALVVLAFTIQALLP